MTDRPGIVVTGASGRMGQMLIKTINENERCKLVAALGVLAAGIGADLGEAGGAAPGLSR